jgi:hypothetical protein
MSVARRAALVVVVGTLATTLFTSAALAQRSQKRYGTAASAPPPPPPATPYPGATIIVDPRGYGSQRTYPYPQSQRRRARRGSDVVYLPVGGAFDYPAAGYGRGGGVYDTNGRPLHSGFDAPVSAPSEYPMHGTPDLSGSPYVAIDGGLMVVDFGNDDRRAFPSCAAQSAEGTPDGRPRTVFYRPQVEGLVLRAGQRGRVIGRPTAGARVCYSVDQYGRMVLAF